MNNILQTVILNNTLRAYLWCFGSIIFAFAIKKYLSKYIAGLFFRLITWNIDKQSFINLLLDPLEVFFVVLVTLVALDRLTFPKVLNASIHKIEVRDIVEGTGTAIMIFTFIWVLLRIIDFAALVMEQKANLTPETTDDQMVVFFKDFFKVLIVIMGILLIIRFSFNKDIGTLLAGLSIVAGALALAARESLENLIASFIIFFDKPFHIGDMVKVHQITGTVEKIGLRSTRIRTVQKTFVTVPNKQMVDSVMDNITMSSQRRADLKLEIDLVTTSAKLQQVIDGVTQILKHPEIKNSSLVFGDIVSNAYLIIIEYYTSMIPYGDFLIVKQDINMQIVKLLETLAVDLAGLDTTINVTEIKPAQKAAGSKNEF
jgi:MscS family membrane protein